MPAGSRNQPRRRRYELKQRAESAQRTRDAITRAAVALHEAEGPSRTTISEIARRAGVDRATVYRHFPDEAALFQACSGHAAKMYPLPDSSTWRTIEAPRDRLTEALAALYGYYENAEGLLANVLRDAEFMPDVRAAGAYRRRWLNDVTELLATGWSGDPARIRAAVALATDFRTWRKLVREHGLDNRAAAELMVAMVAGTENAR